MSSAEPLYFSVMASPVGPLLCLVDEAGAVVRIDFAKGRSEQQVRSDVADEGLDLVEDEERTGELRRQLDEYFSGRRRSFDLELRPRGTAFQRQVWAELRSIPYGTTLSYGELSRVLGRPNASRAVGAANGANPIPIVVPCHRVIGANGSLTGFGGGLEAKKTLLELELRVCGGPRQACLELG